jgi:hypothetical protein
VPGGFFFVNSGLILRADNEAELAGVMAYEIAHVVVRQFQEVKKRLGMLENHRKPASTQDNRPTLRRPPGDGSAPDTDPDGKATKPDQDERPTLKRRD